MLGINSEARRPRKFLSFPFTGLVGMMLHKNIRMCVRWANMYYFTLFKRISRIIFWSTSIFIEFHFSWYSPFTIAFAMANDTQTPNFPWLSMTGGEPYSSVLSMLVFFCLITHVTVSRLHSSAAPTNTRKFFVFSRLRCISSNICKITHVMCIKASPEKTIVHRGAWQKHGWLLWNGVIRRHS